MKKFGKLLCNEHLRNIFQNNLDQLYELKFRDIKKKLNSNMVVPSSQVEYNNLLSSYYHTNTMNFSKYGVYQLPFIVPDNGDYIVSTLTNDNLNSLSHIEIKYSNDSSSNAVKFYNYSTLSTMTTNYKLQYYTLLEFPEHPPIKGQVDTADENITSYAITTSDKQKKDVKDDIKSIIQAQKAGTNPIYKNLEMLSGQLSEMSADSVNLKYVSKSR